MNFAHLLFLLVMFSYVLYFSLWSSFQCYDHNYQQAFQRGIDYYAGMEIQASKLLQKEFTTLKEIVKGMNTENERFRIASENPHTFKFSDKFIFIKHSEDEVSSINSSDNFSRDSIVYSLFQVCNLFWILTGLSNHSSRTWCIGQAAFRCWREIKNSEIRDWRGTVVIAITLIVRKLDSWWRWLGKMFEGSNQRFEIYLKLLFQ